MNFGLNETQQHVKDAAREFFSKELPMAEVRRLIDTDAGYEPGLWKKVAEQGYTGMIFPEAYDGVGLGPVEMAAVLEEMGRALVPGPFVSTVLLAGTLLDRAGSDEQKKKYLAPICRGEIRATLALLERSASWDPAAVRMDAKAVGDCFELTGEKLFVGDAAVADFIIVVARGPIGDRVILIVPSTSPGLTVTPTPGVDLTRPLYRVSFDRVKVSAGDVLAKGDRAAAALARALDVVAAGLSAEMVGGMQQLLDLTVSYAKTRTQFGRAIGSFQAVQHRCVDLFALVEGARSAAYYAAWTLGPGNVAEADARLAVSVAKAYASDAFREAGNSAIQVQGGMGFTWENDAHLYYRRAKGSELLCGDATFHRNRIGSDLTLDAAIGVAPSTPRDRIADR
ncbi:MAG TPA: acyl-CoA dehydrogenase family protein [Vicinamibacterales bacterium]|nr:acyl-CoA dehydrogenase family protein [Vicinamibacterales bacterium]